MWLGIILVETVQKFFDASWIILETLLSHSVGIRGLRIVAVLSYMANCHNCHVRKNKRASDVTSRFSIFLSTFMSTFWSFCTIL